MGTNRYKATITLIVSACLFLLSLPFATGLVGGMVFSAASAALVGGIADWFAVNALFRRPLGISFRTAIIPRNRERIFNDIVDMVENRLLTKEHVKEQIARHNMSVIVINYLEKAGGRQKIHLIMRNVASDLLGKVNPNDIGRIVETGAKRYIQSDNLAPILEQTLRWLLEQGHDRRVSLFLLDEFIRFCQMPYFSDWIQKLIEQAKIAYTAGKSRRKLALWLLDSGGMSESTMRDAAITALLHYLESLKQPDSFLLKNQRLWLEKLIVQLEENPEVLEKILYIKQVLLKQLQIRSFVSEFICRERSKAEHGEGLPASLLYQLEMQLDVILTAFKNSKNQQEELDQFMKNILFTVIDRHHQQLGSLIRENLNTYTNDYFIEFIENKVGDDLQMIRINGSVVGGTVGLIIHAVNMVIK
jgi:uncharacterized membrane-anchored protein YjiN (DUF445 family)